ncbi:hypothetical protein [Mesorhizobium sp. BE184]|uniref:hypothetical protein n=1 Tax=Mesorhizobium sp. BE184 TaxID=2817714 RepID=UPI00286249B4|nr:hypothetical protein [Mesorhizobium sp. BE184]MDR7033042.1 hypothetical protein [Mesorhizobium sp. BE184]
MDGWDRNANRDRDVLERIVALLFALAVLAEQASSRSWFVRRRVLAILNPAEEAAYRCVADAARGFGAPVPARAIVAAGHADGPSGSGNAHSRHIVKPAASPSTHDMLRGGRFQIAADLPHLP